MPLPYSLFQPLRYTQKDKQYLEARKKEYSDYDAQADAYNKLVEAYNTGPQTEEFTAVAPVAPTATEADIQNYQKEAANRARSAASQRQTAIIAAVNPEKYNLAGFAFADGGLVDVDSLSVASFAVGGPVGEMSSAQPVAFDGPLSMADGGLVDINSLSVAAFAEGGEVEERAYTEREVEQMRAAMAQSQADKEPRSPTQQAVKRIAPRATAQGPQQKSSLARQQLYALPPYPLDMTGKLGQAGPIKRAEGSPEYGEIAEQMTVGTLPTDQKAAGQVFRDIGRDVVRGAQYLPYDLIGAPVDIATMAMRPFGYNVEKPFMGSDYLIEKARQAGIAEKPTGSTAETATRIGMGFVNPAAVARQIPAGIAALEKGVEGMTLPAFRQITGNPKATKEDMIDFVLDQRSIASLGAPGIIRPKGGGNLLAGDVEKAIEPLRPRDAYSSEFVSDLKKAYEALVATGEPSKIKVADRMKFDIEQNAPETALDDWIKNKFGNYIKKQMGTEDDPVRKLADEMSAKVQADYQAGLKRIAKMKDDIAKAKAKGKGTEASEAALADEIEKVEEAFQSTSILPSQLGPYTHVNASIGRAREKAGMSPFETAKSSLGKSYEELADAPFAPTTKKEIDARIKTAETMGRSWAPDAAKLTENPWLAKLGEEDLVYRIRPLEINEKEIFIHTIDELRNALNPNSGLPPNLLLKPEDMQGLGIEKAFRHVNNINDWRAQQRVAANLEEAQRSATTIKEYPDTPKRLKWQQLKPAEYTELPPGYSITSSYSGPTLFGPDGKRLTTFFNDSTDSAIPVQQHALNFIAKNDLEKALQYEGSTMRHCVGGYCDDVWSGQTNIFSLRDKKGEPHVTIETAPASFRTEGNTPRDFIFENPEVGARLGVWPNWDWRYNQRVIATPEFQEWLRSKPAEILQIKGKGNARPKEEYIPFVQDFVKSQQWSRIGDLDNTDLVALKPGLLKNAQDRGIEVEVVTEQSGKPYITKAEFNRLADRLAELFGGMNKYD